MTSSRVRTALDNATDHLLSLRNEAGFWEGELSSSALSTATAVVALGSVDAPRHADLIAGGAEWLAANQNEDGGWGDTTLSFSNISTTLLCWAALAHAGRGEREACQRASSWIEAYCGSLEPSVIAGKVSDRYGKDRTFSVPILMLCAIGGRLGPPDQAWKRVLPLPFELAAFPQTWFAAFRLPVVSYALPALIAIGYARHHHAPCRFPPLRWLRSRLWPKTSKVLSRIQPQGGGFLEATPLTSFVTMALANSGELESPVVRGGVDFLKRSVRADGSWPIDTNLATWGTTLAVKALDLDAWDASPVCAWLQKQQYREVHPYTNAPPGGWAWTDLPGGVPDADDTPGALLALRRIAPFTEEIQQAATEGCRWLCGLQNRDGGIPTFCRGWGALPFDRSSPDLTAHALRAWVAWQPYLGLGMERPIQETIRYLVDTQAPDGSWMPLWFGNQHRADEANPTYGTAMVVLALAETRLAPALQEAGVEWLKANQNPDGGWGGGMQTPSSIEETSLAIEALAVAGEPNEAGVLWLLEATQIGTEFPVSPIGFYFAKLWYHERLYPVTWTVGAYRAFLRAQRPPSAIHS